MTVQFLKLRMMSLQVLSNQDFDQIKTKLQFLIHILILMVSLSVVKIVLLFWSYAETQHFFCFKGEGLNSPL